MNHRILFLSFCLLIARVATLPQNSATDLIPDLEETQDTIALEDAEGSFDNYIEASARGSCPASTENPNSTPSNEFVPNAKLRINNEMIQSSTTNSYSSKCNPEVSDNCHVAIAQMIFALSCTATAQNNAITSLLKEMVGNDPRGVSSFVFNFCGGITYWVANLTPDQVNHIRSLTDAVKDVVPDGPTQLNNSSDDNDGGCNGFPARNHLEKRDRILSRENPAQDLSFISTPKGLNLRTNYEFWGNSGEGISAIVIDSGANLLHPEIASKIEQVIFAEGAVRS